MNEIPLRINGINESIYAGFWTRVAANLMDFLFLVPIVILLIVFNSIGINAYYYTIGPYLLFYFWYSVYLVKRNGGTPGKLIAGIKILRIDGNDVGWGEALLRQCVSFILAIVSVVVTVIALSQADSYIYESLNWIEKQRYINSLAPAAFLFVQWTSNIWSLSELFVLLLNERRRALHDLIAGTVVVKSKYIDLIRETMREDMDENTGFIELADVQG